MRAALILLVAALVWADTASGAAPRFVRNIDTGETGWFASPGLVDLDGDRKLEIVAPFYSTFVYDHRGRLLGKGTATEGRVYAPGVVADLDGDGAKEIVVGGNEGTVAAYDSAMRVKWRASTCSGGQCPETRGMAAGDLDRDGRIEVVATTTNTSRTGAQVFVFDAAGNEAPGWPRYNASDADFNGMGNQGYGAYGENVGVGQLDGDPQLEVVVTYDNHQINLFNHDGTSVLASPWYTNRQNEFAGQRLGWGQFIRWLSPKVEDDHYHRHVGEWPHPRAQAWLQWTASPPSIADLDRDGRNEVIGLPNVEKNEPYETQAYAFMVLDGAYGARSARRHKGFRRLPLTRKPIAGDLYPPSGIPAPTIVNLRGNRRPEIVASVPDGAVYAVGPGGKRLWRHDFARGAAEDVRLRGGGSRPRPRPPPRARLRHLRPRPEHRPARRALRQGPQAARHPPARPGDQRQRHRHPGGAVDRRPRRRRAARDRGHDLRPRDRRLPRPALEREAPAVADGPREPAPHRRRDHRRVVATSGSRAPPRPGRRWRLLDRRRVLVGA